MATYKPKGYDARRRIHGQQLRMRPLEARKRRKTYPNILLAVFVWLWGLCAFVARQLAIGAVSEEKRRAEPEEEWFPPFWMVAGAIICLALVGIVAGIR